MGIEDIWSLAPKSRYAGRLGSWPIPPRTLSCSVILTHNDELTSDSGRYTSRNYYWHYLFHEIPTHYHALAGTVWFTPGKPEKTNLLIPPDGHRVIQEDLDKRYYRTLKELVGHFKQQLIDTKSYLKEGDTFCNIYTHTIRLPHSPIETIVPSRPTVKPP